MITGKIVSSLEYGKTCDDLCSWAVKVRLSRFGINLSRQFEQNAVVFFSSSLCLQHDDAWRRTACHTVKQIQDLSPEVLPQPPYLLELAPCDFHFFRPPKRRSTWTSLQIIWRRKWSGAWLAGTATKSLLLRRNSCLSGTLEDMRRTS
jgi:hypothetical protein